MKFDRFARRAEEILAGVPAEYLQGITGVHADRATRAHPQIPGYYTMGECGDDEVARLGDPGGMRSVVRLYHGSFAALARRDPDFNWEAELRETILHEIRHHIEDRAGILDLLEEDAQDEALARWRNGEELPDGWHRCGEWVEPGVWAVADDLFVEVALRERELAEVRGTTLTLTVLGEPLAVDVPEDAEAGEVLSCDGEGLERATGGWGDLHVLLG